MPIKAIVGGVEKEITRIPVLAHDIETAAGTNSVTFNTSSDRVIECDILGNGQQSGTPAHNDPVDVVGCGDRTQNLAHDIMLKSDTSKYVAILMFSADLQPNTYYTISFDSTAGSYLYTNEKIFNEKYIVTKDGINTITVMTKDAIDVSIIGQGYNGRWMIFKNSIEQSQSLDARNIMCNEGQTALPYEPYGFYLPITCAGQTTPIYLGQTQTVRRIGKVDLAALSWDRISTGLWKSIDIKNIKYVNSNFGLGSGMAEKYAMHIGAGMSTAVECIAIDVSQISVNTGSDGALPSGLFWYALATPETTIVNEPLMKIGNYADELHSTDAAVTIPTIEGTNTLTVGTTLAPSQTTVTYRGTTTAYKDAWEVRDNQDRPVWYRNDTLTGISSISFKGYGLPLKSETVKGRTSQNGTPAPDSPVDVVGCGEKTENLFNASWQSGSLGQNGGAIADENAIRTVLPVIACTPETTYTFVSNVDSVDSVWVNYYSSDAGIGRKRIDTNGGTFTTPADCYGLRFRITKTSIGITPVAQPTAMLNISSTALPYEPYGYKIPITNAGQTTPIYLGEVQSTRRIKKLVLTGKENYGTSGGNTWLILGNSAADFRGTSDGAMCSHVPLVSRSDFTTNTCAWGGGQIGDFLINIGNKNMTDIKSYIADQYSAGTPVTVWYVLATPQTGIVNEPLMKIGDYADEVTANTAIPTSVGTNTFSVNTTLAPSGCSITGHIKAIS